VTGDTAVGKRTVSRVTGADRSRRRQGADHRPAFATTTAILIAGVLLVVVVVLGRHAAGLLNAERAARLETQAVHVLWSARDWSRLNADRFTPGTAIELPLDALVGDTAAGRLTLCVVSEAGGAPLVECTLEIREARRGVTRHVYWPLNAPHK